MLALALIYTNSRCFEGNSGCRKIMVFLILKIALEAIMTAPFRRWLMMYTVQKYGRHISRSHFNEDRFGIGRREREESDSVCS